MDSGLLGVEKDLKSRCGEEGTEWHCGGQKTSSELRRVEFQVEMHDEIFHFEILKNFISL